jgi:Flp pilus assembly protein TadG
MVEFAFILPLALLLLLGIIQMAIIGGAALAVNQAAMTCARYAAMNPTAGQGTVNSYLTSIASPLINDSHLATVGLSPSSARTTGTSVSVTVTYDLSGKIFLSRSLYGSIFATQISVTQTAISE